MIIKSNMDKGMSLEQAITDNIRSRIIAGQLTTHTLNSFNERDVIIESICWYYW